MLPGHIVEPSLPERSRTLESLARRDATRTYHLALEVISQARAARNPTSEVHATLHAASAALKLGDFGDARRLLGEAFSKLEEIAAVRPAQEALRFPLRDLPFNADLEPLLEPLGQALEASDLETSGHIRRVVQLSLRFGMALGLKRADLEALRVGAYLHDIGKLGVPSAVLHKPSTLEPSERIVVEQHAVIGALVTGLIPHVPTGTLEIVRHHHERWDARGYPDQLGGSNIPLLARLFSLVDVFDALTQARPYKHAWTTEAALEEIRRQSGTHFDSALVERFRDFVEHEKAVRD
jgi:HD-GYP domain-containing protein (c-di-GMP phosphodiesterase class II)